MSADIDNAVQLRCEITSIVRTRTGMNEKFAAPIAEEIFNGLCELFGGSEIYIPAPDKRARNEAIRARFNGRNVDEIMREFGVSRRTVYDVCTALRRG